MSWPKSAARDLPEVSWYGTVACWHQWMDLYIMSWLWLLLLCVWGTNFFNHSTNQKKHREILDGFFNKKQNKKVFEIFHDEFLKSKMVKTWFCWCNFLGKRLLFKGKAATLRPVLGFTGAPLWDPPSHGGPPCRASRQGCQGVSGIVGFTTLTLIQERP